MTHGGQKGSSKFSGLQRANQGWRCGLLVPASAPLKSIGLKPNRQAAFQNGLIPVKLLVFDIY